MGTARNAYLADFIPTHGSKQTHKSPSVRPSVGSGQMKIHYVICGREWKAPSARKHPRILRYSTWSWHGANLNIGEKSSNLLEIIKIPFDDFLMIFVHFLRFYFFQIVFRNFPSILFRWECHFRAQRIPSFSKHPRTPPASSWLQS